MRRVDSKSLVIVGIALVAMAAGAVLLGTGTSTESVAAETASGPVFSADGSLVVPEDHLEWVFVGASTGLSYSEDSRSSGPGNFHNVYINPSAFRHFGKTGRFPDKTMLALVIYLPSQKDDLIRSGFFEGELTAVDFAVKDTERFEGGWAYFASTGSSRTARRQTGCASCHRQHGAVDNVFVQFYPVLRDRLEERHRN